MTAPLETETHVQREPARRRLPSWLLGSGVIAVAMGVMNVATYGFTILAARLLGPSEYGALAAVMGLLMVVSVLSLGLQATGARRVAASPGDLDRIESEVLAASYRSALVLAVVCLAAVPAITLTLRLDTWLTAALLAVAALPVTVMGGQGGILQGERRWLPLAGIYLTTGLGRIAFGAAGLLLWRDSLGAMVGVVVGAFVPVLVGWAALRHPDRTTGRGPVPKAPRMRSRTSWARGGVFREVAHNSHALLAFFALSNADVLIARGVLDDHQAGLYAGGLILAKAVLFLPQFVVVVAFPSMAAAAGTRRAGHLKALGLVLAIGAVATVGAYALAGLAVTFVGGSAYAELHDLIWAFAAIGTLLSMIQLMVYGVVARQSQRAVYVLWGALLVLAACAPLLDSPVALLATVAAVETTVLLVLLVFSLRRRTPTPPADVPGKTTV